MMEYDVKQWPRKTVRIRAVESRDQDAYVALILSLEQAQAVCDKLTALIQDMMEHRQ